MSIAAVIAACAAGGAAIKRNWYNEQLDSPENNKAEDNSCVIAVRIILEFPEYRYYYKEPEPLYPINAYPDILLSDVRFSEWLVHRDCFAKVLFIKFNNYYTHKYNMVELEQRAKEFIVNTPQYLQTVNELQEQRLDYLRIHRYPLTDAVKTAVKQYTAEFATELCKIGELKLNDAQISAENLIYYFEIH